MYSGVVIRTQVYLGEHELTLLDRVGEETGISRSELIRRAVRESFGQRTSAERRQALATSAGSWKGRGATGAEYVDGLRGDMNERLRSLGLD